MLRLAHAAAAALLLLLAAPRAASAQPVPDMTTPDTAQTDAAPRTDAPQADTAQTDAPQADAAQTDAAQADAERGGGAGLAEADAGETHPAAAGDYGLRVFLSLVLLVGAFFFVRWLAGVLERLAEQSATRRLFYKRLIPILRITIWATALYAVIRVILNIGTAKLVAAATAIGVAVGFAAQDLLKNVFGGFVIILDQPFQVGDKVNIAGTYGEVTTIGLRSTRLVTPDDNLVSVPNAQVVDGQVSNANAGALDCQVVTHLYLPHDADEARAKQIAYEAAASSRYVYLKKPIAVIVQETLDRRPALHLKVKAYVLDTRFEFLLMSDVTERARRGFREAGLVPTAAPLARPAGGDGRAVAPLPPSPED